MARPKGPRSPVETITPQPATLVAANTYPGRLGTTVLGRAYFRDKVPDETLGFADHRGEFFRDQFGLEFVRGGVLYSVPWSNIITFARQL